MVTTLHRPHGVASAFELLELTAAGGGAVSLSDLRDRTDLPTAAFDRLLRTCVELGLARLLPGPRVALGARLVRLGEAAIWQQGAVLQPHLVELVKRVGESASIEVLDGDRVTCLAQAASRQPMRLVTDVGGQAHVAESAAGKAILAGLPWSEVHRIIARSGFPASTHHSNRSLSALRGDLVLTRRRGYAVDDEEHQLGARGYAVVIPGAPTPMALSVVGPTARVDEHFGDQVAPVLREVSLRLRDELTAD